MPLIANGLLQTKRWSFPTGEYITGKTDIKGYTFPQTGGTAKNLIVFNQNNASGLAYWILTFLQQFSGAALALFDGDVHNQERLNVQTILDS